MASKVNLTINGKAVQAQPGVYLLKVCRDAGFEVPSLCNNEAVEPQGRCRLCSVEVQDGKRSRIVASCHYPIKEGIVVQTASPRVLAVRKLVLELLWAKCPGSDHIRGLARRYGITAPRFKVAEDMHKKCILCGLCVRACKEIVGVSAISLQGRGSAKRLGTPFTEASPDCIGCGTCVYICPTNAVSMEQVGDKRIFPRWHTEFKMKKCKVCGNYFAPERQLEYIQKKFNLPEDFFDVCPTDRV